MLHDKVQYNSDKLYAFINQHAKTNGAALVIDTTNDKINQKGYVIHFMDHYFNKQVMYKCNLIS